MIDKKIIALGGGSLAEKTTLEIDEYIANLAKIHAGEKRATGIFIGTASHDSMPYFNSFRKTYTGVFNIKADCVLTVYGEMNEQKIAAKFEKADMIYIGGGDTLFMLDHWKKSGVLDKVTEAYERGVVISGLSAGAICWFNAMYTDSKAFCDDEAYHISKGIGKLDGLCCPHYEERKEDFFVAFKDSLMTSAWCIEGNAALEFTNGMFTKALSSGGNAYKIIKSDDEQTIQTIKLI